MRTWMKTTLLSLLLAAPLLATAGPVSFNFTVDLPVSGSPDILGSGTLITTDNGDGSYLVTSITGSFDGATITGLVAPGNVVGGNDNLVFPGGPTFLDGNGIDFNISGNDPSFFNGIVNLYFADGGGGGPSGYTTDDGFSGYSLTGFTLQRADAPSGVPEPATVALIFAGLAATSLSRVRRKR